MDKTIKRIISVLKDTDENFAKRPMAEQIKDAELIRGIYDRSPCCLLYTSPSPRDPKTSRMPSSA